MEVIVKLGDILLYRQVIEDMTVKEYPINLCFCTEGGHTGGIFFPYILFSKAVNYLPDQLNPKFPRMIINNLCKNITANSNHIDLKEFKFAVTELEDYLNKQCSYFEVAKLDYNVIEIFGLDNSNKLSNKRFPRNRPITISIFLYDDGCCLTADIHTKEIGVLYDLVK